MASTSVAIPPLATWHWLRGIVRHRRVRPWRGLPDAPSSAAEAAGATGILVPTPVTRRTEVEAAHRTAPDLTAAVSAVISGDG